MTREDAIICLKGIKSLGHDMFTEQKDFQESLDMAIKALEQESCEDAVSRKAVFETIDDCNKDGLKGIFCSYDDGERFKKYIKNLPPVTPTKCIATIKFSKEDMRELIDEKMKDIVVERKKGRWIKSNIGGAKVCSICQVHMGLSNFKYCPNCGAEMENVE